MTSLQNIETFLNIEIGEKTLRNGKKYPNKNQYYYYEDNYYIVKLTQDKWMIVEDCRKTRKLLKENCWYFNSRGYAKTVKMNKLIAYHQLFLNYERGLCADHINNHRYDNRSDNFRIVSHRENCKNKLKYINNTSGKQGVSKKGNGHWISNIANNEGKRITKHFSIKKLGNEEAYNRAVQHRKDLEQEYGYIGD